MIYKRTAEGNDFDSSAGLRIIFSLILCTGLFQALLMLSRPPFKCICCFS